MFFTEKIEIPQDALSYSRLEAHIEYRKDQSARSLGNQIAAKIPFKEIPSEGKAFELKVVAFSQEKWVEFIESLKKYVEATSGIGLSTFNLIVFGKMINALDEPLVIKEEKIQP